MKSFPLARGLAVAAAVLGAAAVQAQSNLVDLGLGSAHAINASGEAALDQGIYSSGTGVTPLPSLPGSTAPSVALAINSSGEVAGSDVLVSDAFHPIAYFNGTLTDLGAAVLVGDLTGNSGAATGINANRQIVGWYVSDATRDSLTSFIFSNGAMTPLPALTCQAISAGCTFSQGVMALGINDSGMVSGLLTYQTSSSAPVNGCTKLTVAVLYTQGSWQILAPGTAYALNASGQVTGALSIFDYALAATQCSIVSSNAFLYANGSVTNLGTLPGGANSYGYAINRSGEVVGASEFGGGTATHAFFYNGVMIDLNSVISPTDPLQPFVTLTEARGINDGRLIVANGVDSRTNLNHAYLLEGPGIDVSPGRFTFTLVSSSSIPVTVTNSGATPVSIDGVSTATPFSQTNDCGSALAANSECTITVTAPNELQGRVASGALTITAGGVAYAVALSLNTVPPTPVDPPINTPAPPTHGGGRLDWLSLSVLLWLLGRRRST